MLKQFWEVKHLWGMPPKNSGGSTKFPGGHKVIHRTAQTAFVRVVTPRHTLTTLPTHSGCEVWVAEGEILDHYTPGLPIF